MEEFSAERRQIRTFWPEPRRMYGRIWRQLDPTGCSQLLPLSSSRGSGWHIIHYGRLLAIPWVEFIALSLNYRQSAVTDLHSKILDTTPLPIFSSVSFILIQFWGKFAQILGWRTRIHLFSAKSWILRCYVSVTRISKGAVNSRGGCTHL